MNFDETLMKRLKYLEREIDRLKVWEKPDNTGWIPVSSTWTYASATTITVPSGAAAIYKVGQGIKLNNTDTKYFYIVGVADTVLTIMGGSDYTLDSDAISAVSYTNTPDTAIGFPQYFDYTPTFSASTGTFTTASSAGRFFIVGKTVFVTARLAITTNGTAGTFIKLSIPTAHTDNAYEGFSGFQRNTASGAVLASVLAFIYIGNFWITKYDGTYPGGDSRSVGVSGYYKLVA